MKNTLLPLLLIAALTAAPLAQTPQPIVSSRSSEQDRRSGHEGGGRGEWQDNDWNRDGGWNNNRGNEGDYENRGIGVYPNRPGNWDTFDIDVRTDQRSYYYGENVRIYFKTTRDSFVYIFSTDSDGKTRQIFPNYYDRNNWANGGQTYSIPDRSYRLQATPPSGTDTITAVAVRDRFRDMNKYQDYSRSNPFPRSYGASRLKSRVESYGRRGRYYTDDSTTVRIRRPERR